MIAGIRIRDSQLYDKIETRQSLVFIPRQFLSRINFRRGSIRSNKICWESGLIGFEKILWIFIRKSRIGLFLEQVALIRKNMELIIHWFIYPLLWDWLDTWKLIDSFFYIFQIFIWVNMVFRNIEYIINFLFKYL